MEGCHGAQLDALASFCEQRQLTINLSKTKVVIFEARKSDCKEFVFSGTTVERHDEYRYLGFVFHATIVPNTWHMALNA